MWRRQIQLTKTTRSRAGVPVIPALAEILAVYRMNQGNPQTGFVFSGLYKDKPFDLDTFARRYIEPILGAQNQHWRWWHPFRRGLATNLYRLGVHDKTIQVILRHSSVQTTREIYIKSVGADTIAAMERLEIAIKNKPSRPN